MWKEINTDEELRCFMQEMCDFHDGCVKELSYVSGAYVDSGLWMHPLNDRRLLRVILQRQFRPNQTVELEFAGLKYMTLVPVSTEYTCEISGASMFFKDGLIYWSDESIPGDADLTGFDGTLICAEKLRWRSLE